MGSRRKPRIVFAPQNSINALSPYVERVIEALGHPEAFVSDGSQVGDLLDLDLENVDGDEVPDYSSEGREQLRRAINMLKLPMHPDDFIWKVARRLKKKEDSL